MKKFQGQSVLMGLLDSLGVARGLKSPKDKTKCQILTNSFKMIATLVTPRPEKKGGFSQKALLNLKLQLQTPSPVHSRAHRSHFGQG
jgi:hypothetical protein